MKGIVIKADGSVSYPIPLVQDLDVNSQIALAFVRTGGINIYYRNHDWTGYNAYVTIQYTKT